MNKVFFHLLLSLFTICCFVYADTAEDEHLERLQMIYPERVFIRLPGAMVTPDKIGKQETKLRISGHADFQPTIFWVEQDLLGVSFPQGCSHRTEYSLEFPEEYATMLDGSPLPERIIRCRCRSEQLEAVELLGTELPTFMVTATYGYSAEAANLSPASGVSYSFRNELGAEIPCRVLPAALHHVQVDEDEDGEAALHHTFHTVLRRLLQQHCDQPGSITEGTPLPGAVLVQATQALTGSEHWELHARAEKLSGITSSCLTDHYTAPPTSLSCRVSARFADTAESNSRDADILLQFSAPLSRQSAEELPQKLRICMDGQEAVNIDSTTKKLKIGDEEISFQIEAETPVTYHSDSYLPRPRIAAKDDENADMLFTLSNSTPMRFRIRVHGGIGKVVELTLPDTLTAMAGQSIGADRQHRMELTNAAPMAQILYTKEDSLQIHGKWLLRSVGISAVDATVYRIPADAWQRLSPQIDTLLTALALSRANLRHLHENVEQSEELQATIDTIKKSAEVGTTRRISITDNAATAPAQETDLNHPLLCEGLALHGTYLLELKASGASAPCTFYFLVQNTDICYERLSDSQTLILSSRSTGAFLEHAEVTVLHDDGSSSAADSQGGVIRLPDIRENDRLFICHGDDYQFLPCTLYDDESRNQHHDTDSFLLTERKLYRPGETVHVWGVLRDAAANGKSRLPTHTTGKLKLRDGEHREIAEQTVTISPYGTFAADFRLPEGADKRIGQLTIGLDIGNRPCGVKCSIACEEFRRQDFTIQAELTGDRELNPRRYTLRIHANTHSGEPLSGGEAEISIRCEQHTETHTLPLSADGYAEWSGDIPEFNSWQNKLSAIISVRNERMEYHRTACYMPLYKTDYVYRISPDGRLTLLNRSSDQPLEREQKLRLELYTRLPITRTTGSTLSIRSSEEQHVYTKDITVPAHCTQGVDILGATIRAQHTGVLPIRLHCSAIDEEGRLIPNTAGTTYCNTELTDDSTQFPYLNFRAEKEVLHVNFDIPMPMDAHALILLHGAEIRRYPIRLRKGQTSLQIPLDDDICGNVDFCMYITRPGKNGFELQHLNPRSFFLIAPPEDQLQMQLELPKTPLRAGSRLEIKGRVLTHEGSPADAQVCLAAVDEGILTLREHESAADDFHHLFYPNDDSSNSRFSLSELGTYLRWDSPPTCWRSMMPGICSTQELHRRRFIHRGHLRNQFRARALAEVDDCWQDVQLSGRAPFCASFSVHPEDAPPRLRRHFNPVALWCPMLQTDAEGYFSATATLPDTLTEYRLTALAVGRDGVTHGLSHGVFRVKQDVSLTPGTPLFMSVGDALKLPVTITNNTDHEATWRVSLSDDEPPQLITLPAHGKGVLHFTVRAQHAGECLLRWSAVSDTAAGDAVEGRFNVRYPFPELKETYHLRLTDESGAIQPRTLLSPRMQQNSQTELQWELSTSPLARLRGNPEFLLAYPYGCTEQTSSALLPWLMYQHLSPFCPQMQQKSAEEIRHTINSFIQKLLGRQNRDGGLKYWSSHSDSSLWSSAYAALVLQIAEEQGYSVPSEPMEHLLRYLKAAGHEEISALTPLQLYALGRATGCDELIRKALHDMPTDPTATQSRDNVHTCRFLKSMAESPQQAHEHFLRWMHTMPTHKLYNTWYSGWSLIALHEYLKQQSVSAQPAIVRLRDGTEQRIGATTCTLRGDTLQVISGTVYATLRARGLHTETEFREVSEKGLRLTRLYEKQSAEGHWEKADTFSVGDIVRITLTCSVELPLQADYLALEDYLPACMEAINPNIPVQAAGMQPLPQSPYFDHREYHADRVRGFCTRVPGHKHINMTCYAGGNRAGRSRAPPAKAELMYEPQIHGLSKGQIITVR